jgi:hypothetical protein
MIARARDHSRHEPQRAPAPLGVESWQPSTSLSAGEAASDRGNGSARRKDHHSICHASAATALLQDHVCAFR